MAEKVTSWTGQGWRKSSHCSADISCIEVSADEGVIAVRDSRSEKSASLIFTAVAWRLFGMSIKEVR